MKRFIAMMLSLLLVLSLFAGCSNSSGKKTEEKITIWVTVEDDVEYDKYGVSTVSGDREYKNKYDEAGRLIERTVYYDGEETCTLTYEYDKDGRITLMDSEGEVRGYPCVAYTYDEQGNLTEIENEELDGDISTVEFENEYDEKGRLIEVVLYNEGNAIPVVEYKYDDRGNLIWECRMGSGGKAVLEYTYQYDKNNCLTEWTEEYQESGNVNTYLYENGRLIEIQHDGDSGYAVACDYYINEYSTIFEYDKNGNIVAQIVEADGEEVTIATFEYDGNRRTIILDDGTEIEQEKRVLTRAQAESLFFTVKYPSPRYYDNGADPFYDEMTRKNFYIYRTLYVGLQFPVA